MVTKVSAAVIDGITASGSTEPRTLADRFADVVNVKDFGAVGDGETDDTAAIQAALNAAAGRVLILGPQKTYSITSYDIPDDVTLVSCGSKFYKPAASTTYAITGGTRLVADRLWLEVEGGSDDRGIWLDGEGIQVGEIRVEANTANTAQSGSEANGLLLGPAAGSTASGAHVGSIYVSEWCRPVHIRNMQDSVIGKVRIENYRRGIYINDCVRLDIESGRITGLSPTSIGIAGDNGVLIEASSDESTRYLTLRDIAVEQSGEHGFRVGSQFVVSDITFDGCSSRLSGAAGAAATGGAGLKVLGGSVSGKRHKNIRIMDFVSEDCSTTGTGLANFSGLQIGYCDGVTITGFRACANTTDYCGWYGVILQACSDVQAACISVTDARQYAISIRGFAGGNTDNTEMRNITLSGGLLHQSSLAVAGNPVIHIDIGDFDLIDLCVTGVELSGGTYAIQTSVPDTGSYTNLRFDVTYSNPTDITGAPPVRNDASIAAQHFVRFMGPWYGTFNSQAADGSIFQDTTNGLVRIKKAGAWTTL